MKPLLVAEAVRGGYGEADADILNGVDIELGEREIVTVAGTNGAGKSTLIKAILGLLPRCTGRITFGGIDLRPLATEARIEAGLGYVPQVDNIFRALTVRENLEVVAGVHARATRIRQMFELFPSLAERSRMSAGALSGGERQQLAFARALMAQPRLLLCDEPTAALAPAMADQVLATVKGMAALGVSVLLVEQNVRAALGISGRGYVLDGGQVVAFGPAQQLLGDQRLAALYLGAGMSAGDARR